MIGHAEREIIYNLTMYKLPFRQYMHLSDKTTLFAIFSE